MINKFYINEKEFSVSSEMANSMTIESHPKKYEVIFEDFLKHKSFSQNEIVLIDKKVANLYNITHDKLITIEALETNKSIETVLEVCERLMEYNFDRSQTLVVIGGGILQDIGAYVAKTYKRGINWIYFPTTLLSQCDSCIGGKTALNFKKYKNQLALFSAPTKVIIDTNFLKTLSEKDITSGYGEIIKLFLIGGNYYIDNIKYMDYKTAIFHSLSIKKAVIEYDEFENLERKALNYGHSFGHVIEPLTNYDIPHGEAVMIGIEIINKLFSKSEYISDIISNYTTLSKIKSICSVDDILKGLKTDKKVSSGNISLIVVRTPGHTEFVNQPIDENLYKKGYEIFAN
jgi:3-dehydroquinate synthase